MSIVPKKIEELLTFADNHANLWSSQAANLGLSTAQANAFKAASIAARADFNAQVAAEQAKLAATNKSQGSIRTLRKVAGETINLIKAFANTQANPDGVYQTAQIPPPATPGPRPAPGTPTDFTARLNPDGSVTLRWKCDTMGAGGTVYNITRRIGNAGNFVALGAVGLRAFTDAGIPAGSSTVQYVVTAQRAEAVGNASSPFTVLFGSGGATITAQFTESANEQPQAKLVA